MCRILYKRILPFNKSVLQFTLISKSSIKIIIIIIFIISYDNDNKKILIWYINWLSIQLIYTLIYWRIVMYIYLRVKKATFTIDKMISRSFFNIFLKIILLLRILWLIKIIRKRNNIINGKMVTKLIFLLTYFLIWPARILAATAPHL